MCVQTQATELWSSLVLVDMRCVLSWLLLVLLTCVSDAQIISNGAINPPPAAVSAGYNTLTLDSTFASSTVDTNATYASGFAWYIANYFGYSAPDPITINPKGGAVINGSSGNANLQIVSAALGGSSWVGTAYGGGAYFEATISFNPSLVNTSNGWPSFWAMSIEHLAALPAQQWSGQASGYIHFIETDFFEYDTFTMSQPNNYGGSLHDWYGIYNVTCSAYCGVTGPIAGFTSPSSFNWSIPHKYGFLWIPATGSSSGSATFYIDDVSYIPTQTWSQYNALSDTPPPTTSTPWTFGILDQQHMVIILGSGSDQPMTVNSVRVWQASAAGNIVQ